MEAVLYSRVRINPKINVHNERLFARVAILYSDMVGVSTYYTDIMGRWQQKGDWNEQGYCSMYESIYCKGIPGADAEPGSFYKYHEDLKFVRKIKHKDKSLLVRLNRMELAFKEATNEVDKWLEIQMNFLKLDALLPFTDDDTLVLIPCNDADENTKEDDTLVRMIIETFSDYENDLVFDQVIEILFPYKRLDKEAETNDSNSYGEEPFFYSTELFEFPLIIDLTYPQLLNVRNELKPLMDAFDEDHEKLKTELSDKSFKNNKEDYYISTLNKFITPHLKEIQAAIDKNIYIQQEKNTYSPDHRIKVMLGITSIENQIRFFEKEEIIKLFVADSIIDKLSKNFNVENCYPFLYHIYSEKINFTP